MIVCGRILGVMGVDFEAAGVKGGLIGIAMDKLGEIPEGFRPPLPQPFPICDIAG